MRLIVHGPGVAARASASSAPSSSLVNSASLVEITSGTGKRERNKFRVIANKLSQAVPQSQHQQFGVIGMSRLI